MNSYKKDSQPKEMFKTTCNKCKKDAEVPFKPSGDRPVLCQDCFKEERDSDRGDREMFKVNCSKCKQDAEVPFKPSGDKPVLCRDCFSKERGGDNKRGGDRGSFRDNKRSDDAHPQANAGDFRKIQKQFEALNKKVDLIIKSMDLDTTSIEKQTYVADPTFAEPQAVSVEPKKEVKEGDLKKALDGALNENTA